MLSLGFFFLNLLPICQLFKSFSKMVTFINTIFKILRNVKDVESLGSLFVANFDSAP